MVPIDRSLRQFLLSPATFFDERPPAKTIPLAAGLVILFTLCLTGAILLVGSLLAGTVDATVTMDNPDRPPEPICAQHADNPDSVFGENCDEPKTIERDASELVQEAVHDYLWIGVVGPLILWLIGTIVLFGAGRLAGGTPSVLGSLALAGWAALPEFFRLAVGLVGIQFALSDVMITDPEQGAAVVEAAMAPLEPVFLAASLITVAWQWYLLTGGLSQDADIPWDAAAIAVGVPLGMFFLFGTL